MSSFNAIVSIHDVAPNTLERVDAIIKNLPGTARDKLILLVIPGLEWTPPQIDQLKRWQDQGHILAGHGWFHHTENISRLYHKLHSLFVSRNVAEHLSLSSEEIIALMQKNFDWFTQNNLSPPDCYVPPAWALGPISDKELARTPYPFIETTQGYIHVTDQKTKKLPLVGYEADTQLRRLTLIAWNGVNESLSSTNKPLRISIHPYDPDYLLSDALWSCLDRVEQFQTYHTLFNN